MAAIIKLQSTITCPLGGGKQEETMPTSACLYFNECKYGKVRFQPKEGDCCVYCSCGTVKYPPMQTGSSCCASENQQGFYQSYSLKFGNL